MFNNVFTHLSAPAFLFFYISLVAAAIYGVAVIAKTEGTAVGPLPVDPDPYETAFLRGGVNEVARLVVFNLLRVGALRSAQNDDPRRPMTMLKAKEDPGPHRNHLENVALEFFQSTTSMDQTSFAQLRNLLSPLVRPMEARLLEAGFLTRSSIAERLAKVRNWAIATICLVAAYRIGSSILWGHYNVGFTVLLAVFGSLTIWEVGRPQRISLRGRNYLRQMRTAYSQLPISEESVGGLRYAPALIIAGVCGLEALANTPASEYVKVLRPKRDFRGMDGSSHDWTHTGRSYTSCSSGLVWTVDHASSSGAGSWSDSSSSASSSTDGGGSCSSGSSSDGGGPSCGGGCGGGGD